ncbi:MAG: hypothetical protein AB8B63_17575 [Granulosicoccus sp.]
MNILGILASSVLLLMTSQVGAQTVANSSVSNVLAQATGSMSVRVSWNSLEGAAYYEIYQDGMLIQTRVTETSLDVSGLQAGTFYQYFVTACTAEGVCTVPGGQSNVLTNSVTGIDESVVCPAATEGSSPVVSLAPNENGTAVLTWCEVTGADGYNLFLDNFYETTYDRSTLSAVVAYDGSQQYQVAWYSGDNYPAKSAVAIVLEGEPPMDMTDLERLLALDASGTDTDVEIYFTRHAEKATQLAEQQDGSFVEICGEAKCAEVLNAKGELRAELLRDLFNDAGITDRLTHAFSSHKIRTRQTIELIAADAGLTGDLDKNAGDGIQEFPVLNQDGTQNATELDPEGTSASEAPVIEALLSLEAGSVALVAGHSGTLYDIMSGLGLSDVCLSDTVASCNQDRYPINDDVKVRDFGDIWKVTLEDGVAQFVFRANFQPAQLTLDNFVQ